MVSGEFPASPPAPPGAAEGSAARWQFFISYTGADRAWAEWIAWQLEDAGYAVLVQAWDFVPGSHWTSRMDGGARGAERTLAVLSRAYLASVYGRQEWEAAFGLADDEWELAKNQLREAILEAASERRMTWYSEVASRVSVVHLKAHSTLMNHLLTVARS